MPNLQVVTISQGDRPVTRTVQDAIDQAQGPVQIDFAAGCHICAGLRLRSDVTLHFHDGAELHFVPAYSAYAQTSVAVEAEQSDRAMIMATGASGITICGRGRIYCDGSRAFSIGEDSEMGTLIPQPHRPRVLVLDGCRNVDVSGLRIEDSPMWTLHFVDCDDLSLSNLHIDNNRKMPNTDGIVIDGCRNVRIKDCTIRTADDGVVLKTSARVTGGTTGPCEQVHVTDCVIESRSCALKLGTESFAPFRHITFEDILIETSNRGIGIFSRDGGLFDDIRFSRIDLTCHETPAGYWGSGEAVTINTIDRRPEDGPAGAIRNIVISDIIGTMQGAINLFATRLGDISNITLRRVALQQDLGPLGTGQCFDLRPTSDDRFPSDDAAGRINAWRLGADGKVIGLMDYPDGIPGVYASAIQNLILEDVVIDRPTPLPSTYNADTVVETSAASNAHALLHVAPTA